MMTMRGGKLGRGDSTVRVEENEGEEKKGESSSKVTSTKVT